MTRHRLISRGMAVLLTASMTAGIFFGLPLPAYADEDTTEIISEEETTLMAEGEETSATEEYVFDETDLFDETVAETESAEETAVEIISETTEAVPESETELAENSDEAIETAEETVSEETETEETETIEEIAAEESEIAVKAMDDVATEDVVNSGTCGANVSWTLTGDKSEGYTLTISGSGNMENYSSNAPWYSYRDNIKYVEILTGVSSIGDYAFYNCSSLTTITIPESVTNIGQSAFSGCSSLASIKIPDGVISIGSYAIPGTCLIICSENSVIAKSGNYNGQYVTSTNITGKAGRNINYDFDAITRILTFSGSGVFYTDFSFSFSKYVTEIFMETGVTSLPNNGFRGYSNLRKIILSNGITDIVDYAFMDCTSLTSITIPEGVTIIRDYAFCNCNSLTSITFPKSVASIGWSAFEDCKGLTSIALPDGIAYIGEGAFRNCSNLTSITIPKITNIEYFEYFGDEFRGCKKLSNFYIKSIKDWLDFPIYFNDSPTKHLFMGGSEISEIIIPYGISNIRHYAFSGCRELTSIIIPDSVTSIGDSAFSDCSNLTSITIPKNLNDIESKAFSYCTNLLTCFIYGTDVSLKEDTFDHCDNVTIYCQSSSNVAAYAERLGIPFIINALPTGYSIQYELNGGANAPENPDTYTEQSETIVLADAKYKGYTFMGWYTDAKFNTRIKKIPAGSTGDYVLYAKWNPNTYTIKFDGKAATSGTMNALTGRKYDTAYTLPANAFKRTGCTFTGWNTKKDGSGTKYANKASVKNLTATNNGTVTLFAQWKKTQYSIKYVLNGGKNNSSNPATYTYFNAVTLKNPTRTGYTFVGWYSDAKLTKKVTGISQGSAGTKTFYARWTINKYTIKLFGNGSTSGSMKLLTNCKYGTAYTLTDNAYKRNGYFFAGWNTKKDGSGTAYKNKASVKNLTTKNGVTVTLYAQWKIRDFTITYNMNGGKNNSKNPATYRITSAAITLATPVKTGYTFGGWYTDKAFTASKRVTTIPKGSYGNKTFYAKWTANMYTIKFSGNGATSGSMKALTGCQYGKAYTLTANAFKKNGYVFKGWNTKADGTGTTYANKASVKNLTATKNGTVTLYAKWEKLVSYKYDKMDNGELLITVKNNNSYGVFANVKMVFYNGSTVVDNRYYSLGFLEAGKTSMTSIYTADDYYTSYKTQFEWEKADTEYEKCVGNSSNIEVVYEKKTDNSVKVSFKNNGKAYNTRATMIFYKNGKVVGIEDRYLSLWEKGDVDYAEFYYPYDENGETIIPTSYKIIIESYYYVSK